MLFFILILYFKIKDSGKPNGGVREGACRAGLPPYLQINGGKPTAPPPPSPRPLPGRAGAEGSPLKRWPRPSPRDSLACPGLVPGLGRILSGGGSKLPALEIAFMWVNVLRCRKICPGNVLLRRARERQEEKGEASHLFWETREMPEPRDAGCPSHTAPQKPLCPLCEESLCAKTKKAQKAAVIKLSALHTTW